MPRQSQNKSLHPRQESTPVFFSSALENFEVSPLRFEYEIHLEEYRAVRSEIELHLNGQQLIINYELAVLAGFIAAIQYIIYNASFILIHPLCFGFSTIFSAFALIYFWHDTSIATLAGYVNHVLRPQFESLLSQVGRKSSGILIWDEFQSINRLGRFPTSLFELGMSAGRYAVIFLPSIGLLVAGFIIGKSGVVNFPWEFVLRDFAIVAEFLVIVTSSYSSWMFLVKIQSKARTLWRFPNFPSRPL